jgi:hypothetical protein
MGQSMVHAKEIIMIKLLQFIVMFLSSLFEEHGFSITASNNSGNRFAGASILMASSEMEIFLAIERDEITAQFRSVFDKRKSNWYSVEIVLALVGRENCLGVIDDRIGSYIQSDLPAIISRFGKIEVEQTLKILDEIEKKRFKSM